MQFEPETIDEAFYDRLREHYSEEEIVELGAFIGFNVCLLYTSPSPRDS